MGNSGNSSTRTTQVTQPSHIEDEKKSKQQPEPQAIAHFDGSTFLPEAVLSVHDFEFISVIERSNFGKMMRVKRKSNDEMYTLRVVKNRSLKSKTDAIFSRKLLSNLDHPFICSTRLAFQSASKAKSYFLSSDRNNRITGSCMRYIYGKDLSVEEARFYSAEILIALGFLHSVDIIFGCLTLDTIMVDDDGHILIVDDLSQISLHDNGNLVQYSPVTVDTIYAAPELSSHEAAVIYIDKAVDWWSFGVVLFEMLTGKQLQLTDLGLLDENAQKLVSKLLHKDPHKRLGNIDILDREKVNYVLRNALQFHGVDHEFIVLEIIAYLPKDADCNEIHVQPFYDGIDFEKVRNKEMPTFRSKTKPIQGQQSLEDEFLQPIPAIQLNTNAYDLNLFAGFTYNPQ